MDIFFLLLFVGCIAIGFFQGMIKLLIAIFSFYLGLVLASLYYPSVADFLVRRLGSARYVGEYMGFAVVLLISFFVLLAAGIYTFRYARIPGRLQYLDRIIGTILGVLLGGLFIGIFAAMLYNMLIVRGGARIDFPIMRALGRSTSSSFLVDYFRGTILNQAYAALDPVLPDGARLIFSVQ